MARIEIPLEAGWYDIQSFGFRWRPPVADRPSIAGDIAGGAARFLEDVVFRRDRSGIVLNIAPDRTTAFTQSGNRRLSSDFETSGSIAIEFNDGTADRSWSIDLGGRDTSEPYRIDFTAGSDEDTAFDALAGTGSPRSGGWLPTTGTLAATLILDDGQPELAVDAEPAAVTVPAPTAAGIEADVENPSLLPYSLDLAFFFNTGSAGNWTGTIPAAYVEAAADQAIVFEYAVVSSGAPLNAGIHIAGGTDVDLIDDLEAARLKIQSADGATTYGEVILADVDSEEPYIFALEDHAITSERGGLRLRFERATDPVNADPAAVTVPAPAVSAPHGEPRGPLPVDADPADPTIPAPSAAAIAAPHAYPVDAEPAAVTVPAPAAAAEAGTFSGDFVDVDIDGITLAAPTVTAPAASDRGPLPIDTSAAASLPAPAASARAAPHAYPVDIDAAALLPAPTAVALAAPHGLPVDADPAAVTIPAPAAGAPEAGVVSTSPADVQPARVTVPAPTAVARARPVSRAVDVTAAVAVPAPTAASVNAEASTADALYKTAVRASAPSQRVVTCIELVHPSQTEPIRLVDDGRPVTVDGEMFHAARFESEVAEDVEQGAPVGQLVIGNVGRDVSRWIDAAGGGAGGTARVFEALLIEGRAEVEWELVMDITSVAVEDNVTIGLGFAPLLDRPAVALRYDPQTAPGLF